LSLRGTSTLTLLVPSASDGASFKIHSHGAVTLSITAQPPSPQVPSSFSCTKVDVVERQKAVAIDGTFNRQGGDSITLTTAQDVQLDFRGSKATAFGDTAIPIVGTVRLWEVGPAGDTRGKPVLLAPPSKDFKNEVVFEAVGQKIGLNTNDLLEFIPHHNDFYLRKFGVGDGIHVELHGTLEGLKLGAGLKDLHSVMPSTFDQIDARRRFLVSIPAIAAVLLGILDKMGLLKKKNEAET
jgi:hypothetical protein